MDFITLHALAREWDARWRGAAVAAAWTQSPRELSLALETASGEDDALRVLCDSALAMVWRQGGAGRQRRNTADVLPGLVGRTVAAVRTPERDRFLVLDLDDGSALWCRLFGPRPNAVHVREGAVADAFLGVGADVPNTRPAPHPETPEAFAGRWRANRKTLAAAVRGAAPLLHPALAADACRRAGLDPEDAPPEDAPEGLWRGVQSVLRELEAPAPHLAWRGEIAEALLPAPLRHPPEAWRVEAADSFDRAASLYARRTLGQRRYRELYAGVEKPLARAATKRQRSAGAMLEELAQPSRAEGYEAWGHLLMAQATGEGPGREEIELPNILAEPSSPPEAVTIPLDPALSAIENAERYYDKARRTRRAREEAEARWETVHAEAEAMSDLLARLRATDSLHGLQTLLEVEDDALAQFLRPEARGETSEPFHRFPLHGGYEALVGKHARGNAHLTTRVASPHDLWLHARGVPGSHVVVKKPGRASVVPPEAVAQAARLAARFSTAKTQSQVPVQVTERKYVRPVKGGPPGLVRVEREEVLLVEPAAV